MAGRTRGTGAPQAAAPARRHREGAGPLGRLRLPHGLVQARDDLAEGGRRGRHAGVDRRVRPHERLPGEGEAGAGGHQPLVPRRRPRLPPALIPSPAPSAAAASSARSAPASAAPPWPTPGAPPRPARPASCGRRTSAPRRRPRAPAGRGGRGEAAKREVEGRPLRLGQQRRHPLADAERQRPRVERRPGLGRQGGGPGAGRHQRLSRRNSVRKAGSGRMVVVVTGSSHARSVPRSARPLPPGVQARADSATNSGRGSPDLLDQRAGLGQQLAHGPPQPGDLGRPQPVLERVPVALLPARAGRAAVHPTAPLPPRRGRPARAMARIRTEPSHIDTARLNGSAEVFGMNGAVH